MATTKIERFTGVCDECGKARLVSFVGRNQLCHHCATYGIGPDADER